MVAGGQVPAVERRRQIELAALGIAVEEWVADVLDKLFHLPFGGVDIGSLVGAGKKGVAPVLRALDRIPSGAHRHEAGEILVFRSQAVGHPRPGGGADEPAITAIHEHQRRLVIGDVGVHRADDEEPVGMTGHRWEQIADLEATLAVATEGERRGERGTGAAFGGEGSRDLLTGILFQRHLAIEGVEVARAPVGEQMDDGPGPRGEVRRPRRERAVDPLRRGGDASVCGDGLGLQEARRPEPTEPQAGAEEGVPTGDRGEMAGARGIHGGAAEERRARRGAISQ